MVGEELLVGAIDRVDGCRELREGRTCGPGGSGRLDGRLHSSGGVPFGALRKKDWIHPTSRVNKEGLIGSELMVRLVANTIT